MSDSLQPHEPQHTRPPCPSPTPRVCPSSCPLSRWCHPTISFSVISYFPKGRAFLYQHLKWLLQILSARQMFAAAIDDKVHLAELWWGKWEIWSNSLQSQSFLLFMLAYSFLCFLILCFSCSDTEIILFLTWLSVPYSCFLLRLVTKDHVERGAVRKIPTAAQQQTCEAVSDVPASTGLLAECSHKWSQPTRWGRRTDSNQPQNHNNKSLLFQSTGFWSSLLYNNRYEKYHYITLGISGKKKCNRELSFTQSLKGQNEPLLDCGVRGYRKLLLLLPHFSRVQLCVTPWTAAHQAPPSMGFSRQEYWNGVPSPSPRKLLTVQIAGRFCCFYYSCGHNHLSNLKAGDWKLGSWVASTYSCPPSFQLSRHSGWKMAHDIPAFGISYNGV